jgi:hypothetical protein
MRTPSRRIRWRTSFFCTDRYAADSSFSRPANCSASRPTTSALISSSRLSRSALPAIRSACSRSADANCSTAA